MIRHLAILALILLAGCPAASDSPAPQGARNAPPPSAVTALKVVEPKPGNLYASETEKQLFVAWSLPRDLAPIRPVLSTPEALQAVVARTAVRVCAAKRAELSVADKPCKLQLLRLGSNDEYSKSAAGAWTTAGKFMLPPASSDAAAADRVMELDLTQLKALFTRFDLRREELQ